MRTRWLMPALMIVAALSAPRVALAQYVVPDLWGAYNGPVYSLTLYGETLYLGGNFDYVGPRTGGGVPLSVLDASLPVDFPRVHGDIAAVAADPAGGFYIAGTFDSVGALPRRNLARLNADLSVAAWNPGADQPVSALLVTPTAVYVGGSFSTLGVDTRHFIGAIHPTTGAILPWNPDATGDVRCLALSGANVYAGGTFTHI
jgi:trimeric autotransporter adhesin